MRTYEITIKPLTGFATPLKGDTIFGQVCWQAAYDNNLFGKSIDDLLVNYKSEPFLVISSAFIKNGGFYVLKRPDMPSDMLFDFNNMRVEELISRRKELKAKKWMLLRERQRFTSLKSNELYFNDKEIFLKLTKSSEEQSSIEKIAIQSVSVEYSQPHNTINRLTGTTGEGRFAPYSVDQKVYIRETELVIFAGLSKQLPVDGLIKALKNIGKSGFGKDASIGLGKFEVLGCKEIDLFAIGAERPNACYTLSPCVPQRNMFSKLFFTPFTRFGRHGDILAKSGNPFKNPVIMADEGAVFVVSNMDVFKKPYIGVAITGISKVEPNTVAQGYSLYIPIKVEE